MNYQEIANRIVAQDICEAWWSDEEPSMPEYERKVIMAGQAYSAKEFCHDWRVAGALMERCPYVIESRMKDGKPLVRIFKGFNGCIALVDDCDSLPLAIVLASLEALEGEK